MANSRVQTTIGDGLLRFLVLTYLFVLANTATFVTEVHFLNGATVAYVLAVWLTYSVIYLLPVAMLLFLLVKLLGIGPLARGLAALRLRPDRLVGVVAVLCTAGVQLFLYADGIVFRMYGFHANGFVWNILSTPGGIESLGATRSTKFSLVAIVLSAVAIQSLLLVFSRRSRWLASLVGRSLSWRTAVVGASLFLILAGGERMAYGLSDAGDYQPIVTAASAFPFYTRARMHSFAQRVGIKPRRDRGVHMAPGSVHLNYPVADIERDPATRDLNVVWLVSESWRWDMLNPQTMPATSSFADQALSFVNHYSGGNGTRMGMFSMFYGLFGSYWFSFLNETRSPAVLDLMVDGGYDLHAFTSARFSFPEFDKTIFSRLPSAALTEGDPDKLGWENDQANVSMLLDSLKNRDSARPFFRFMFFESPHASYYFPDDAIIAEPYLEDMNYATMDLDGDMPLIKNRYINACHHLDMQFARVIEGLEQNDLLDSTIVVMTGDHGEEFMEKGRWGHHSAFSQEQIRVPLVLWVPGQKPEVVQRMTSHLDIVPTLLTALGVTNPVEDYSLGLDLLGDARRDHVVVADWDHLAWVDEEAKVTFPVGSSSMFRQHVTTRDDEELLDVSVVMESRRSDFVSVLSDLGRFSP